MSTRTICPSVALIFGLASAADTTVMPTPICDRRQRGRRGRRGMRARMVGRSLPSICRGSSVSVGYHIGPEGRRCWLTDRITRHAGMDEVLRRRRDPLAIARGDGRRGARGEDMATEVNRSTASGSRAARHIVEE
jgi:hypothetical protein